MPADRSLDAAYFDGIFASDEDPWALGSSAYEAAKFDHSVAVLADRRADHALEIGCAQGELTARLAPGCDRLLAIDIARDAVGRARDRCRDFPQVEIERMAFPAEAPSDVDFDLIILSEVAYYWSDQDLMLAAAWIEKHLVGGGRVLLVHWILDTDYPQTGDGAVERLHALLADAVSVARAERLDKYRLDLWVRR